MSLETFVMISFVYWISALIHFLAQISALTEKKPSLIQDLKAQEV